MIRTLRNSFTFEFSPGAYIELTKPRIVILLVFTCVASMIVAADAVPPADLLMLTIFGWRAFRRRGERHQPISGS